MSLGPGWEYVLYNVSQGKQRGAAVGTRWDGRRGRMVTMLAAGRDGFLCQCV